MSECSTATRLKEVKEMELCTPYSVGFWWQRKPLSHFICRNGGTGKSWIMSVFFFFLTKDYTQNLKNLKHSIQKRVKTKSSWPKCASRLEEVHSDNQVHRIWSVWKADGGQMRNAGGTWTSFWCPWYLWRSPAIQPALQIWPVLSPVMVMPDEGNEIQFVSKNPP